MNPGSKQERKTLPLLLFIPILLITGLWGQQCLSDSLARHKKAPAPHWLELRSVAQEMRINGVASKVWTFNSNRGPEEILSFYRDLWQPGGGRGKGVREAEIAPWKILSHLQGKLLYTVQVRKNDSLGASGYVALSNMAASASHATGAAPALPGSRVLNDTWSKDPGQTGETILLVNQKTPRENSLFYKGYYGDRGWSKEMEQQEQGAEVLLFRHKEKEAHMVIRSSKNRTWITLELTETSL
jgi:hypothetical protein